MTGEYIATHSGQVFYFERPEDFRYLESEIGFALGKLCRWAGHGRWWSVAQHSLFVSELVEPRDKLRALLHDASEAYLVDVPGPLKHMDCMAGYRELEARVRAAIHKQFGVIPDVEAEKRVKWADATAGNSEAAWMGLYCENTSGTPTCLPPLRLMNMNNGEAGKAFEEEVRRWSLQA
jgi:hypothetical protein